MTMQLPILVFDIETVTDVNMGSQLYGLHDLPDAEAIQALHKIRRSESGSDFPRLPLHEIVCVSGLWVDRQQLTLFSWTREQFDEVTILKKFIGIFEKRQPILVSWNGSQFDIPVILHRCMHYGLSAPNLFDQGEFNKSKRYDNYQNRYQLRHTDLMDVLSHFNVRNVQKLDDFAQILGLPGKGAVSGHQVTDMVLNREWQTLSCYCEGDVLNTWLIYLRWLLLRGFIDLDTHRQWVSSSIDYLCQHASAHVFLKQWKASAATTVFTQHDFDDYTEVMRQLDNKP